MRYTQDPEQTEREIADDVRNILKGQGVKEQDTRGNGKGRSGSGNPSRRPANRSSRMEDKDERRTYDERRAHRSTPIRQRSDNTRRDVPPAEPGKRKRKRRGGKIYAFVSYAFVAIFLLLIGHMIYFNLYEREDIVNSPYNKRLSSAEEYVIRGDIKASDGTTLATTKKDSSGKEYRSYPQGNLFAHVVGFASHGKSGLESKLSYTLLSSHSNPLDQLINEIRGQKNQGDTAVTTLDVNLQKAAYSALGSYNGAVVAMDPSDGTIKAMVSKPDFDPNQIDSEWSAMTADKNNSQLVNRATQGLYPPGSTFKIVTTLAYYRKYGTLDNFQYNCTGSFPVDNIVVHCFGGEAHGQENFTQAFAHSCNTAFSQIGLDVGISDLTKTAHDMMFGETVPKVVATSSGRWNLKSTDTNAALVQTAFGQGQTLTNPYHMALIVSSIANNGVLMQPRLVDHIENDAGDTISTEKSSSYKTMMSGTEASLLQNLMKDVITEGTGRGLAGQSYEVAGKTGSADYIKNGGSTGTHSWFVGYGQKDGRKLVVTVIAEDGGAGSTTAVPMAKRVFDTYFG